MDSGLKILIVRFSSIGDIVLTTPVVRYLHEQGNAEVHYMTKSSFEQLLKPNPRIHKIWTINKSIVECIPQLKAEKFDLIIDLHNNIRTQRLKLALGTPSRTFKKLNLRKWLFTGLKIDSLPNKHIVDRYLETIAHLKLKDDEQGLDFFLPKTINHPIIEGEFVACVIGGQHDGKQLPLDKWKSLFTKSKRKFIVVGGPEDQSWGDELESEFDHVESYAGKLSIMESAFLVKQATWVITNDTGLMHIASAFQKNIISLWGQTSPKFGMFPYRAGEKSLIIEPTESRPLSKLGNKKTKLHAMYTIDMDSIVKLIN